MRWTRWMLLVGLGACAGTTDTDATSDNTASDATDATDATTDTGDDTTDGVRHATDLQPLWDAHCVQCHTGAGSAAFLRLDGSGGASAFDVLLETDSSQVELPLVTAGEPERSYLWVKVTAANGIQQAQMPLYNPPLSDEDQQLIEDWILDGALP